MARPPRILLTNDDGVDAPGLAVLREIAAELSDDVWVVAPDANQSGAGHRFSFGRELAAEEREPQVFAIPGASPADCVVYAMTHLLAENPADLVLSGVNNGQNLGDIIHCSGTAAGAREGALQGAVGIALSQAVDYAKGRPVVWDPAQRFGASVVRQIFAAAEGRDTFYNVNFPLGPVASISGVQVVPPQRFAHSPFGHYPSENQGRFFIAIPDTPLPLDPQADFETLHNARAITVSPVSLVLTDVAAMSRMAGKIALE